MWANTPYYPKKDAYQWAGYQNREHFLESMAKWGRMTVKQVVAIEQSMDYGNRVLPGELESEIERRRSPCPTCGM